MKLYILELTDSWLRDYGSTLSMLVCAENEEKARILASDTDGEEIRSSLTNPWLNPQQSACYEVIPGEKEGIIMIDRWEG